MSMASNIIGLLSFINESSLPPLPKGMKFKVYALKDVADDINDGKVDAYIPYNDTWYRIKFVNTNDWIVFAYKSDPSLIRKFYLTPDSDIYVSA